MADQTKTVIGIFIAIAVIFLLGGPGILQAITEMGSGISHEFSWYGIEFKAACNEPGPITDGAGNLLAQRDSELQVDDSHIRIAVSGAPFRQPPGGIGCLLQTDNLDLTQYSKVKLTMFGKASSAHKRASSVLDMYVTDGRSDVPIVRAATDGYYRGTAGWGDVILDIQPCTIDSTLYGSCMTTTKSGNLWTIPPLDSGLRSSTKQAVDNERQVAEAKRKGPQDISFSRFGTRNPLNLLFALTAGNNDDVGGGVSASMDIIQIEISDRQGNVVTVVSNRTRPTLDRLLAKGITNGGLDQSSFKYVGNVMPVSDKATFVPIPQTGDILYTGQGEVIIEAPLMTSGTVEPAIYVFETQGDVGGQRTHCSAGLSMIVDNHTIYDINNFNIIPTVGSVGLERDTGSKLPFQDIADGITTVPERGGKITKRIIFVFLPDDMAMWSSDDGRTYSSPKKVVSSGVTDRDKNDIVFWAQTNNGGLCPVTFRLRSAKRMTLEKFLTDGLTAGTMVTDVPQFPIVNVTAVPMVNVTAEEVTPEQLAQDEDDVLQLLNGTRQGLRNEVRGGGLGVSGGILLAILAAMAVALALSGRKR